MNNVSLIGRLTADPEVRYSGKGKDALAICNFSLAVNRPGKDKGADFIRITAFGGLAETIEKYVSKGNRIGITGSIQTGSYEDKDGKTVYTTDVIAAGMDFCESASKDEDDTPKKRR